MEMANMICISRITVKFYFALTLVIIGARIASSNHTIHYKNGIYSVDNLITIDIDSEYILSFPNTSTINPYRVSVSSLASRRYPAMIVVRQEKQVLSWQVPMLIGTSRGYRLSRHTARTLCFSSQQMLRMVMLDESKEHTRNFSVSVSTSSTMPISVIVRADEVSDYFIENEKEYRAVISPSEPVFYFYQFPDDELTTNAIIDIDSEDDICLVVSIQHSLCPVRDLNKDIRYEGDYQTINLKGGLRVRRKKYPDGFFLVFVAMGDNYACNQESLILPHSRKHHVVAPMNRTSAVKFRITEGISFEQYVVAVLAILGTNLIFCLIFIVVVCISYYYRQRRNEKSEEGECETQEEPDNEDVVDGYLRRDELTVQDFIRNRPKTQKKTYNYLWHIMNIGIFYGIPVVQLMASYQRMVNLTGDLDMCYHNFLCAHPLFGVNDFNHIYSNIGYIVLGFLLLGVTLFTHKKTTRYPNCGIPKHYGLFYAMSVALILEGIFSACYHICPTQSNYQFDTSFMYVMAVLCIVKLYQNRHPSINASAYATFTVLGVAVFVAMLGILTNSKTIMVIFILSYIVLSIYLSFKIYFFGYVIRGMMNLLDTIKNRKDNMLEAVVPIRKGRFILLLVANICNILMAGVGVVLYPYHTNFGTYLLGILLGNAILHTIFYIAMKIYYKERVCWEAVLYGVIALAAWAGSCYFFVNKATEWTVTPAESRHLNSECVFMDFYDNHDIWHLLSAPALFFTFIMLMHLDDDLIKKPQSEIVSF